MFSELPVTVPELDRYWDGPLSWVDELNDKWSKRKKESNGLSEEDEQRKNIQKKMSSTYT